ncbi:hypothetical protein ACFX11_038414 [Malus domestica]
MTNSHVVFLILKRHDWHHRNCFELGLYPNTKSTLTIAKLFKPVSATKVARSDAMNRSKDGSTAENEDMADSEVEGSSSVPISQHAKGVKRFVGSGDSSDAQKEVRRFADSNVVNLNGQKRFNISSENEYKLGNMAYGNPFSLQSVNMMNIPYSLPTKESNSVGATTISGHPMHGMMQAMPTVTGERTGTQPVNPGNLPVMFGYSPVQLPMLDKDNSWGAILHA